MLQKEILHKLMNSKDDILEDDALLNSLNESKKITADITRKLKSAKHLQDKIENSRKAFKPVAVHGAKLFFVVQSLKELDPMYDFSMKWFRELF
jgi:dynein heavy chain